MNWRKLIIFIMCLLPLVNLLIAAFRDELGPDPGKEIVLNLGFWALSFLWLTLSVSPLKRWTGNSEVLRYRRMLGLYCWFYATIHLLAVLTYLLGWDWAIFLEEFSERPYMALGIIAWCLLLPLGLTSNRWAMKKLAKRWKRLHQLVYLIAALALMHFIWQVRSDYVEVLLFAVVLLLLMIERLRLRSGSLAVK